MHNIKIEIDTINIGKNHSPNTFLEYIQKNNVYSIYTSPLYNNSQNILGSCNIVDFDITTTTPFIDYTATREENFNIFRKTFYQTQKELGYIELHGLVIPKGNDLLSNQGLTLWDLLLDFKDKEYVRKIGVRVSTPQELTEIIDIVEIDMVQLPLNIINQSFINLLPELKKKKIEIHTYSTFMNGIILHNPNNLSGNYNNIKNILTKIPEPKMASAISIPKSLKEVNKIVIGCNDTRTFDELVEMYNYPIQELTYTTL